MKILIVGDSYAVDWTVKYNDYPGWPNLLAKEYNVVNYAQAGVSQYKILKQLQAQNINEFDVVISSFTSPYRVHTLKHPVHYQDKLHKNSDLLAIDCEYAYQRDKNNESLATAKNYFKYHFDFDYYEYIYSLMLKECENIIGECFHIKLAQQQFGKYNWGQLNEKYKGLVNHLSQKGNEIVFEEIKKQIDNF
jgi:hypothetical protein|tara:strand:- start:798 stop:1373 length:576 start_codon:yes stop_codon:yes gene_type:complete